MDKKRLKQKRDGFKAAKNQLEGFVMAISKGSEVTSTRCVEKDLLEEGLRSVETYVKNYTGKNVQRSETRLYGLYEVFADVLKLAGKKNIIAQGMKGCSSADLTVACVGNTYDTFTSFLRVSPDLLYRDINDALGVVHGIEIRNGSVNLGKNIHNNVRSLSGEVDHFNHIIRTRSNIEGNFLTVVNFINIDLPEFNSVVSSMLGLYETGKKVAVVPYRNTNNGPEVLLGAVPSVIQLMEVLKES